MSKLINEQTYTIQVRETYAVSTNISDGYFNVTVKAPPQTIKYTPVYKLQLTLDMLKRHNSALEEINKLSDLESLIKELYQQNKITLRKKNDGESLQLLIQTANDYGGTESLDFNLKQEDTVALNTLLHKENIDLKNKVKELEQKLALGDDIRFEEYSQIMTSARQIKQIAKWIDPNGGLYANLLYRASEHGDDAYIFHQRCDNKGPTLVVISTVQGTIIGGYTEANWCTANEWYEEYQEDEKAFVFNLTTMKKFKVKQPKFAIRCNSKSGPIFGNGCDIYVGDDFKRCDKNYINGGVSYDMESKYELLDKYEKFEINELEVFSITKDKVDDDDDDE